MYNKSTIISNIIPYAVSAGKIAETPIKRLQSVEIFGSLCCYKLVDCSCLINFFNDIMNLCQDTESQVRLASAKCLKYYSVFTEDECIERLKREINELLQDEEISVAEEALIVYQYYFIVIFRIITIFKFC